MAVEYYGGIDAPTIIDLRTHDDVREAIDELHSQTLESEGANNEATILLGKILDFTDKETE